MIGIALVRGINVGGKNVLPMADLRSICEKAGLKNPRTLIQSGNVVFDTDAKAIKVAAERLADAIESARGFRPAVMVRTAAQWEKLIAANPFADQGIDGAKLLVMITDAKPKAGAAKAIADLSGGPDVFALEGDTLFIHYPNGVSGAKVSMAKIERALGVSGTCRNWNVITKLAELAAE